MGCEICGSNACAKFFHSIEEQELFDKNIGRDDIINRIKDRIESKLNRLKGEHIEDEFYIKLTDAINVVREIE